MIHPVDPNQILVSKEINQEVFADLSLFLTCEKSLDYLFYYRISPLAIYNSFFLNLDIFKRIEAIEKKYDISFDEEIINQIKTIQNQIDKEAFASFPITATTSPRKYSLSKCSLRQEQQEAINRFFQPSDTDNQLRLSSGSAVLPSGSGKTILGIEITLRSGLNTLFILPNETLLKQWEKEILDKTDVNKNDLSCDLTKPKLLTLIVASHLNKEIENFKKDKNINQYFSLLVIDEIHKLKSKDLQTFSYFNNIVKIGLTATFYFPKELEKDIFFTIGHVVYNSIHLNQTATISYNLIKIPLNVMELKKYHTLNSIGEKYKMASLNETKYEKLRELLHQIYQKQPKIKIIIFCQYIEQVQNIKKLLGIDTISSQTAVNRRIKVYEKFNTDEISIFATTSISNEGVDLPSANCIIQMSGKRGNAIEEYQRLGRLLRNPEGKEIFFYALVSQNTIEEKSALERQAYLPKNK